jgi:purine-nucleoside phosphorylase
VSTYYPLEAYDEAADYVRRQTAYRPEIALVLGSGLSGLANAVEHATVLPYDEIPHFPISTVPGHAGRLVLGELNSVSVCVMQGRFHFYEGYSLQQVTFPIRVMQRMGVRTLILTNAAGGVNAGLGVGDLMLIEDHINFVGMAGLNPLSGPNMEEFGPRFPAANHIYTKDLQEIACDIGAELNIELRHGVYTFLAGPNFETAAEVRMLAILGADAVGMSTVPEALVGHHAGMDVLAISTITNICIDQPDAVAEPTHEETQASGEAIVPKLTQLLLGIVARLGA